MGKISIALAAMKQMHFKNLSVEIAHMKNQPLTLFTEML